MVPDAHLVELDGADHFPFVGDAEAVAAEIEEFLVGSRAHTARQRRLLTLVFTDIAQSTTRVVERGDDVWRELLAAHDQDVRRHLARFGGQEVKHLGDGLLAAFEAPPAPSAAPSASATLPNAGGLPSGSASTPASASWSTETSAASPCI